ncbi:DUF11 domain-containing protein [Micromonospora thermarum]|uniref:DUF11 domain-containing protein n=1 Tax=Micromonospora thermarum TaxID=2720024 RepID=A0ABX0ZCK6_9ACTN|nr:DUF11 domain-containing protein [Micromonospora thermarum]NJP35635.1 hypothetical protein [Micromonospora thermarum]
MWESIARSVVGMMTAATAVVLAPAPSPAVEVAPVLTSTPFGALPGQQVTHTITVSGQGTVTAARVTFTTTADLDGVTARAEPGRCTVSARSVVCDLGSLLLTAASPSPRVTITGSVRPGAPAGTLIRNRVTVTSAQSGATGVTSNAYLLPGSTATPSDQPQQEAHPAATRPSSPSRWMAVPVVAAVIMAGAVTVGLLLTRRRLRRRHAQPPPHPSAVTAGRRDPI